MHGIAAYAQVSAYSPPFLFRLDRRIGLKNLKNRIYYVNHNVL